MNHRTAGALTVGLVLVTAAVAVAARDQARPAVAGVIAGTVTDAVSGSVLSGVLIEAMPVPVPGAPAPPIASRRRQVTDSKGRYTFRGLPAATYAIRASVGGTANAPNGFIQNSSGFPITPYLAGGYGQRIAGGLTRPLVLDEGEQANADIAMWPTAVIAGNVFDELGDPLVEAVVGAVKVTTDGRLTNGPSTRTDDRGAYRLSGLAPGRYLVYVPITQTVTPVASAEQALLRYEEFARRNPGGPGRPASSAGQRVGETVVGTSNTGWLEGSQPLRLEKTGTLALPTTFYPGSTTFSVDGAIALKAGEERSGLNITVKPERTAAVNGTLSFNGSPAGAYFVRLLPSGSADAALFEVARAQTDGGGRFVFPAVPLGAYVLESSGGVMAAFATSPGTAAPSRPGPAAWVRESIAVGEEGVSGIALTFRPGLEVRGRVEFVGAARMPDATALKNIRVFLPGMRRSNRVIEEPPVGIPDANGALGPIAVPPGRYVMRLMTGAPPPWQLQSVEVNGRDVAEQPLELTESLSNVVLTFTDQPASLTATVSGGSENAPVLVMLFPASRALWPELRAIPGRALSALTGRDGRAVFSNVLPGDYLAVAMPEADAETFPDAALVSAVAPMATSVTVSKNAPTVVTLTIRRPR